MINNILLVGHSGHGKSTLFNAMIKFVGESSGGYVADGGNLNILRFNKDGKAIQVVDPEGAHPGADEWNLEVNKGCAVGIKKNRAGEDNVYDVFDTISAIDEVKGALLIVSGKDGPMPQTRGDILFCRTEEVKYMSVVVTMRDLVDDEELTELVEMEVRELLSEYEYPGDDLPVVFLDSKAALDGDKLAESRIQEVMEVISSYFVLGNMTEEDREDYKNLSNNSSHCKYPGTFKKI